MPDTDRIETEAVRRAHAVRAAARRLSLCMDAYEFLPEKAAAARSLEDRLVDTIHELTEAGESRPVVEQAERDISEVALAFATIILEDAVLHTTHYVGA